MTRKAFQSSLSEVDYRLLKFQSDLRTEYDYHKKELVHLTSLLTRVKKFLIETPNADQELLAEVNHWLEH